MYVRRSISGYASHTSSKRTTDFFHFSAFPEKPNETKRMKTKTKSECHICGRSPKIIKKSKVLLVLYRENKYTAYTIHHSPLTIHHPCPHVTGSQSHSPLPKHSVYSLCSNFFFVFMHDTHTTYLIAHVCIIFNSELSDARYYFSIFTRLQLRLSICH